MRDSTVANCWKRMVRKFSETVTEKPCKREQAKKKKSALAQKFWKNLLEQKIKIRGASEGADGLRKPHALQKEIL